MPADGVSPAAPARWLPPAGYAALLLYLLVIAGLLATRTWFLQPGGQAVPADFIEFWTAARFVEAGEALAAYDPLRMQAAQSAAAGRWLEDWFPFPYPPGFLLVVAPLALLPFAAAWAAWILVTGTAAVAALWPVLGRLALPLVLGAPATFWCAVFGQNGLLTAALMAGMMTQLDRRPLLAGACLGLLGYKPHLGLLLGLALLATRRWRALLGAVLAFGGLALLATIAFGWEAWAVFLARSRDATAARLVAGGASQAHLQSVFALAREVLGASAPAMALHFGVALVVTVLVLRLVLRGARPALQAAALVAGTLLVSPYAYVYDAPVLTVAAAFLLRDMLDRGAGAGEQAILALALVLPAALPLLGSLPGPLAGLLLLGVALRRARSERAGAELA